MLSIKIYITNIVTKILQIENICDKKYIITLIYYLTVHILSETGTCPSVPCVVVTNEYKVLRKVSVTQPDEQSINFTQMVDGTPVESSIPKDIIVEIYKVVGNYRRQ